MKDHIRTEVVTYQAEGIQAQGYLAAPRESGPLPGVLIAHAWKGLDEFARKKANALAELGIVALCADLYGGGITAESDDEALELMTPLFLDRKLLQKRMDAALNTLLANPLVDKTKVAAMGFCFGGLATLELLKSGAPLSGAVTFHAVLGDTLGALKAKAVPVTKKILGKLLILHGYEDPLVSRQDIIDVQDTLNKNHVDWQMIFYSQTSHAFTNPEAQDKKSGLLYNPKSDQRSWQAMRNFFEEIFS